MVCDLEFTSRSEILSMVEEEKCWFNHYNSKEYEEIREHKLN